MACAPRGQEDDFEGFPTDCTEVELEELGPDEVSATLGVSAEDVVQEMTAIASGPATVYDTSEQVDLDITTTVEVVGSTVRVLDLAGTSAPCLNGQFLEAEVRVVTSGTMDGWSVQDHDVTTIYASGAGFDSVWLAEKEGVAETGEVAEELADFFQAVVPSAALSGDPATWTWKLGPAVYVTGLGPTTSWRDATARSSLSVFGAEGGVDFMMGLVMYVAGDGTSTE